MEPPQGERQTRTANRSGRILGLLAAVGFSIAMWVFIAVAILGLILKVVGPHGAEEGLAAAGISMPQGFGLDDNATDTAPANDIPGNPATAAGPLTRLDGQPLEPADGKPSESRQPGGPGTPPEAPTGPAPGK
jgi:hypothetical protein